MKSDRRTYLLARLRDPAIGRVEMDDIHAEFRGRRPITSYTGHPDGTIVITRASLIEMIEGAKERAVIEFAEKSGIVPPKPRFQP